MYFFHLGNVMSILILTKPEMKNSFHRLLTYLAVFDFLFLLDAVLIFGLPNLSDDYATVILPQIMPIG